MKPSLTLGLAVLLTSSLAFSQSCTRTVTNATELRNTLTDPNLAPGSVICVQPGMYDLMQDISIDGAPARPIVVRGVLDSMGNRPVIRGVTQTFQSGLLHFTASSRNWIVEDLVLRDCLNPAIQSFAGPAGIFLEGRDITIRRCELVGNRLGLRSLNSAEGIVVESCEVHGSTRHNVSMLCRTFVMRGCWIHDCAPNSVNYKERCEVSLLEGNWISRPGSGSYNVDFGGSWSPTPNGTPTDSYSLMIGNVVVHDTPGATPTVINIGDGSGNEPPRRGHLALINNTLVAVNEDPVFFRRYWNGISDPRTADTILTLHNNIAFNASPQLGWGAQLLGAFNQPDMAWATYPVQGSNNWFVQTGQANVAARASALSGTLFGLDPEFVDLSNHDFGLRTQGTPSPCLDAANPAATYRCEFSPDLAMAIAHLEYDAVAGLALRPRRADGALDIGAFEAEGSTANGGDLSVGGSTSIGLTPGLCAGPHRIAARVPASGTHVLFISDGTLGTPLTIPGVGGQVVIDVASPLYFPLAQGAGLPDQLLELSFTIPPVPAFVGFSAYFQSLTCDPTNPSPCRFSNDVPALVLTS